MTVGLTDFVPDVLTAPMPLSIETDVAFVLDHVNVEDCPELILVGLAVIVTVGVPAAPTVTVAVAVTVAPFVPVAVAVYVVVAVGETFTEPFGCTVPTPLSIVTVVALVEVHVSVEL